MLEKLRHKKVAKKIWIVLALIIVPAFILWGSESLIQSLGRSNYAGKVFNSKVSLQQFNEALLATRNQLLLRFGDEFLNQEDKIDLAPQAWERIILLSEAKKRKIKVSDKEVTEFIERHPLFQRNNKFDFSSYEYLVKFYFRTQPRAFEEQIRENIILMRLYEGVTQAIQLNDEQIREAYRKENEKISVFYLSADPKEFLDKVFLNTEQLEQYFKEHPEEFRRPALLNLEYLDITPVLKGEIPEKKYDLGQISRRVKKIKNLSLLAKELGLKVKETGFFDLNLPIPGIGWSWELLEILDKLKTGELSPLIKTENGWYILRLKEKKASFIPDLKDIENEVRDKLIQLSAKDLARQTIEKALLKLSQIKTPDTQDTETTFESIAQEFNDSTSLVIDPERSRRLNLKSGTTELFKRSSYISTIGSSDKFFNELAGLKDGALSGVIEMEQGFFIIKLKEMLNINEEKYNQEKEEFRQNLLLSEKNKRFIEWLLELKQKANLKVFPFLTP